MNTKSLKENLGNMSSRVQLSSASANSCAHVLVGSKEKVDLRFFYTKRNDLVFELRFFVQKQLIRFTTGASWPCYVTNKNRCQSVTHRFSSPRGCTKSCTPHQKN